MNRRLCICTSSVCILLYLALCIVDTLTCVLLEFGLPMVPPLGIQDICGSCCLKQQTNLGHFHADLACLANVAMGGGHVVETLLLIACCILLHFDSPESPAYPSTGRSPCRSARCFHLPVRASMRGSTSEPGMMLARRGISACLITGIVSKVHGVHSRARHVHARFPSCC